MLTALEVQALGLSLWVSSGSVAVSLAPGVALGWLLARRDFRGKSLLDGLVHLPLVLPPVVVGYLLLVGLGGGSPVGRALEALGLPLAFSWRGAVLAAAVVSFPLLVRAIRLSVEAIDPGLEEAARTLGASPARVFFRVTLPLMAPGILAGTLLAFARALSEFGATITFAGNLPGVTRTLPTETYLALQTDPGRAVLLSLLQVGVSLAVLLALRHRWVPALTGRRP